MEITNLQRETMVTKLLTDCVTSRRIELGLDFVMNSKGVNDTEIGLHSSNTLSVALGLALLDKGKEDKEELWPELMEYYFSDKVSISGVEKSEEIANQILLGWADIIKER